VQVGVLGLQAEDPGDAGEVIPSVIRPGHHHRQQPQPREPWQRQRRKIVDADTNTGNA
jgi:hypothetical protein